MNSQSINTRPTSLVTSRLRNPLQVLHHGRTDAAYQDRLRPVGSGFSLPPDRFLGTQLARAQMAAYGGTPDQLRLVAILSGGEVANPSYRAVRGHAERRLRDWYVTVTLVCLLLLLLYVVVVVVVVAVSYTHLTLPTRRTV